MDIEKKKVADSNSFSRSVFPTNTVCNSVKELPKMLLFWMGQIEDEIFSVYFVLHVAFLLRTSVDKGEKTDPPLA